MVGRSRLAGGPVLCRAPNSFPLANGFRALSSRNSDRFVLMVLPEILHSRDRGMISRGRWGLCQDRAKPAAERGRRVLTQTGPRLRSSYPGDVISELHH